MKNQEYWKNKKALITGGSSGLGQALAIALDSYGAHVVTVARNRDNLERVARGRRIHIVEGDVSQKQDIYRIAGESLGQLEGIDFLFNNASYLGETPLRLLMDTECEDLEKVLQTNVIGPFRLTKALLPNMILQNHGTVVNISSDAAISAYPHWGSYSISKAALDHLSRVWSEELSSSGIRFLAIDPGDMNTPMHLAAIPDANVSELYEPTVVAENLLTFLNVEQNPKRVRFDSQDWRQMLPN